MQGIFGVDCSDWCEACFRIIGMGRNWAHFAHKRCGHILGFAHERCWGVIKFAHKMYIANCPSSRYMIKLRYSIGEIAMTYLK